jgi:hypothetical protein
MLISQKWHESNVSCAGVLIISKRFSNEITTKGETWFGTLRNIKVQDSKQCLASKLFKQTPSAMVMSILAIIFDEIEECNC